MAKNLNHKRTGNKCLFLPKSLYEISNTSTVTDFFFLFRGSFISISMALDVRYHWLEFEIKWLWNCLITIFWREFVCFWGDESKGRVITLETIVRSSTTPIIHVSPSSIDQLVPLKVQYIPKESPNCQFGVKTQPHYSTLAKLNS